MTAKWRWFENVCRVFRSIVSSSCKSPRFGSMHISAANQKFSKKKIRVKKKQRFSPKLRKPQ